MQFYHAGTDSIRSFAMKQCGENPARTNSHPSHTAKGKHHASVNRPGTDWKVFERGQRLLAASTQHLKRQIATIPRRKAAPRKSKIQIIRRRPLRRLRLFTSRVSAPHFHATLCHKRLKQDPGADADAEQASRFN